MAYDIFDLRGTEEQNNIILDALRRTDFPFELLKPKLFETNSRTKIPVEWDDLSVYGIRTQDEERLAATPIEYRERVLGLAWYSGMVTIEQDLVSEPELAKEVFLSEGAHMVDFFYMTDEHRIGIWNALHPSSAHLAPGTSIKDAANLGHGHGWFDIGSYEEWAGEEFMGLFVKSFSDVGLTISFVHDWDQDAIAQVRNALVPTPASPQPPVEQPVGPIATAYFSGKNSKIYHDSHKGILGINFYATEEEALAAGLRPCKVCKP